MQRQPFIHRFRTDAGFYIYDVNTNRILKASEAEYDLVEDCATAQSGAELFSKWGTKYSKKTIEDAVQEIDHWREQGYLSSNRPQAMRYPVPEEQIDRLVDAERQQLILNITEKCNLRCRYCAYSGTYYFERTHSDKVMPLPIAKKAVDSFWSHSRDCEKVHISFYGGEPLMCFRRLKEVIEYVRSLDWGERQLFLHVDTNGTLLNEQIARFFIENDVYLQVSLDGPKDIHDRFRVYADGSGSFDKVMENLDRIRAIDPEYFELKVAFAAAMVPPYDLVRVCAFFGSEPFAQNVVTANTLMEHDTSFYEQYASGLESMLDSSTQSLRSQYIEHRVGGTHPPNYLRSFYDQVMVIIARRAFSPLGRFAKPNGICIPGVRRVFVSADGCYYPCEKTIGSDFKLGNVERDIDIDSVRQLIDKYIAISTEDCTKCWAVRLCSLCFFMARRGDRLDRGRKMDYCAQERAGIDSALRMYTTILERNPSAFEFTRTMVVE